MNEINELKENRIRKIAQISVYCALFLMIVSLVGQIYVANNAGIISNDMNELQSQKVVLEKEISEIKIALSTYSSIAYVDKRAQELGFVEPSEPVQTVETPVLASITSLE